MANLPAVTETLRSDWGPAVDIRGTLQLVVAGRFTPQPTLAYTVGETPVVGSVDVTYASGQLLTAAGAAVHLNPNTGSSADAIATPTGTAWQLTLQIPGQGAAPLVRYLHVPDSAGPVDVPTCLTATPPWGS